MKNLRANLTPVADNYSPGKNTQKIALYYRVSTDDQTTEPQRQELVRYCDLRGWAFPAEYSDSISGTMFSRKGLDRLLEDIRRNKVKVVVCVKMDRLGRSLTHLAQLLGEFQRHGVALICTSQGIDTSNDNPAGELQRHILMAVAQFEHSLIIERTIAGLDAARARGVRLGRPSEELTEQQNREITAFLAKAEGAAKSYGELSIRTGLGKGRVHNICTLARAVWHSMRARCENPSHESFANYGGRGITVCEQWQTFEGFIYDMGVPPAKGLSIDRKDSNLGYNPENCRWATPEMQGGNRRNNRLMDGITQGEYKRRLSADPEYGHRAAMRDMEAHGKDIL